MLDLRKTGHHDFAVFHPAARIGIVIVGDRRCRAFFIEFAGDNILGRRRSNRRGRARPSQ